MLSSKRLLYHGRSVVRITTEGKEWAAVELNPARIVPAQLEHDLAMVDLLEELVRHHEGSRYITERELRARRHAQVAARERPVGVGRIADGSLVLKDGTVVAVELDLTAKRDEGLAQMLDAYSQEDYSFAWLFTPSPRTAERYGEVIRRRRAEDFARAGVWLPRDRR